MAVITVRIDDELLKELESLQKKLKFRSLSELVREALREFVLRNTIPWKSREEVFRYFSSKKKRIRGLEDLHVEEDVL